MNKVFVYGTLLSGEYNSYHLANAKLLGEVILSIPFEMHDMGAFPALVESDINTITGEVWEISDKILESLDYLEGYPQFYSRKLINTKFGDAWVYFCNNANDDPIIQSGDWKEYLKGK